MNLTPERNLTAITTMDVDNNNKPLLGANKNIGLDSPWVLGEDRQHCLSSDLVAVIYFCFYLLLNILID